VEILLLFLFGLLSGILYNEHIYRRSLLFPRSNPLTSFLLRFSLLGVALFLVAKVGGAEALLSFVGGNLVGRFVHTFLRAFLTVR